MFSSLQKKTLIFSSRPQIFRADRNYARCEVIYDKVEIHQRMFGVEIRPPQLEIFFIRFLCWKGSEMFFFRVAQVAHYNITPS